jgi:hypothetical protein
MVAAVLDVAKPIENGVVVEPIYESIGATVT